jgi:pyruvate dehydrogenase E2 component (dihydrolipoamide acetyltransferase)
MATNITMPKLSDTMTEGRFGSWRKSVGERVERGEIIAEVETDKAVMELEAFATGVLLEQRAKPGELIVVGAIIGQIGLPGELPVAPSPAIEPPQLHPPDIVPERVLDAVEPAPPHFAPQAEPHDEKAAPVVRRRARELRIDLTLVEGSGPGGRILLEDLERFSGVSLGATAAAAPSTEATLVPEESVNSQIYRGTPQVLGQVPLSRMRAAIARTVSEAWRTIPHFYLSVDLDMAAAVEVRRELQLSGTKLSINDLVIKASALAIAAYPQINAAFADDALLLRQEINIGIAVALPDGLLVPVVRNCEGLSLKEIAARTPPLVAKARAGQLGGSELLGGTFTISNLGMYGTESFAAVIHPGQAAILAVGASRETVVVRHGAPTVGKVMTLTLSADHRVLDGAYAAEFLRELKGLLEAPVRLLI